MTSRGIKYWAERLDFLETELATAVGPDEKFALRKKREEARKILAELRAPPTTLEADGSAPPRPEPAPSPRGDASERRNPAPLSTPERAKRLPRLCNETRVHSVKVSGKWLVDDELYVCAVQPPPPPLSVAKVDESRSTALALAHRFLEERLAKLPDRPVLVLFPELAFGSGDFAVLNGWVGELRRPTIVLAGFGFCSGESLKQLIKEHPEVIETAWPENQPVDPDGAYNAGWCWIHRPDQETRCVLFLKNFAEQKVEIASIPDWTPGTHILRLNTDDLTLFPLICADVICDQTESPRRRIRAFLAGDERRDRKVLVTGLLYCKKTYSGFWKTALNDLTAADTNDRLAVFFVNHSQPKPREAEIEDSWRSLTGAFLHRRLMCKPLPHEHVRFVETEQFRGLVLRQTRYGTAEGILRWRCGSDRGSSVWLPNRRHFWLNQRLEKARIGMCACELSRFISRKKRILFKQWHDNLRPILDDRLEGIRQHLDDEQGVSWIANLWPRLLYGPENPPEEAKSPDTIPCHEEPLLRALCIVAIVNAPGVARLLLEEASDSQLMLECTTGRVMVWSDPKNSSLRQVRILERLTFENGCPALLVIGKGATGSAPSQKVEPHRRSDITRSGDSKNITMPRSLRPVYWLPLEEVENVLDDDDWVANARDMLNSRLREKIKSVLRIDGEDS